MDEMESLSHTKWECKYHVVFIPKCRRKTLYGELRRHLGEVPQAGGAERESDRRRVPDAGSRAHDDCDSAEVCGVASDWVYQGESAIHLARVYGERKRNFVGQHFWARWYWVSTVGRNEEVRGSNTSIHPEPGARRPALDQINLWR